MRGIRERLKKYRFLRRPYNFLIKLTRYLIEYFRFFLPSVREALAKKGDIKRLLLIRTSGIGDVIRITPILAKLRRRYKEATIYVFTKSAIKPVIANNPDIDIIYTENEINTLLNLEYDLVINWQIFDTCSYTRELMKRLKAKRILGRKYDKDGNYRFNTKLYLRTWMETFCKIALVPYHKRDPEKIRIYLTEDKKSKETIMKNFNLNCKERYVGICLGGNEANGSEYWYRNFSIEFLKSLIEELGEKYKLILVGRSKDRNIEDQEKLKRLNTHPELLNLIDRLKLEELMAVIENCSCFISTDTGPLHIAMALQVPTVALFSNNTGSIYISPKRKGKYYSILYNGRLNCFPCEQIFEKECSERRRAACVEGIPISEIVKEVEQCITTLY